MADLSAFEQGSAIELEVIECLIEHFLLFIFGIFHFGLSFQFSFLLTFLLVFGYVQGQVVGGDFIGPIVDKIHFDVIVLSGLSE